MWDVIKEFAGPILAAVGAVVVGAGGLTAIAFLLFKWLGEKWLSNKFAEHLEAFKHEQQKEIEHVRFEINKLMDRTTKLHQREFEILPKAWALLVKSYHSVRGVTASLRSYPDFSRMTPPHLEEFLADCPLQEWQKLELRQATDQNKYYQDAIFSHHTNLARVANRKSAIYLARNGIFMPPPLKIKFDELDQLAFGALIEHEMNKQHDLIPRQRAEQMKFLKEGERLLKEIEVEVQKRLWMSVESDPPKSDA
jgi:hypothetical protein